jgi:large subunit ribosomal protein L25
MAETLTLSAETRSVTGKKVKQLRREGKLPAVIYGKEDTVSIQLDRLETARVLRTAGSNQLLSIDLDSSTRTVIVRDIQQHLLRRELLHIDFYEVKMGETLRTHARIVTVGQAAPVAAGDGLVTLLLQEVEVECLPSALVSELEINLDMITSPEVTLFVRDLYVPSGVDVLTDPETPVAAFSHFRDEEEIEAALMAEEFSPEDVEVIGEEVEGEALPEEGEEQEGEEEEGI